MFPWIKLVYLGDSAIMLPAAAAVAAWLATGRAPKLAILWSILFLLGLALVGTSKIAFLGWGAGLPAINFKAFSGHAMRTTAVMPVLLYLMTQKLPIAGRISGVALGLLAGVGMCLLLLAFDYHSLSEVLAGWGVGAAVSLTFIRMMLAHPAIGLHRWLLPVCLLAFLGMRFAVPHSTTHVMTEAALYLSGNPRPYNWNTWKMGC